MYKTNSKGNISDHDDDDGDYEADEKESFGFDNGFYNGLPPARCCSTWSESAGPQGPVTTLCQR